MMNFVNYPLSCALTSVAVAVLMAGCGSDGTATTNDEPAAVSRPSTGGLLTSAVQTYPGGDNVKLAVPVTAAGASDASASPAAVTWKLDGSGTLVSTSSGSATYTPPAVSSSDELVKVTALRGSTVVGTQLITVRAPFVELETSAGSWVVGDSAISVSAAPSFTTGELQWEITPADAGTLTPTASGAQFTPQVGQSKMTATITARSQNGAESNVAVDLRPAAAAAGPSYIRASSQNVTADGSAVTIYGQSTSGSLTWTVDKSIGTLVDNHDGTATYTPPAAVSSRQTITVTANDGTNPAQSVVLNLAPKAAFSIKPVLFATTLDSPSTGIVSLDTSIVGGSGATPTWSVVSGAGNIISNGFSATLLPTAAAGSPIVVSATVDGLTATQNINLGTTYTGKFGGVQGVVQASDGDMYAADNGANVIVKITKAGQFSKYAGTGTAGTADGTVIAASFTGPNAMATYGDYLYVTDGVKTAASVRRINIKTGVVDTLPNLTLANPLGISVSPDGSRLYVAYNVSTLGVYDLTQKTLTPHFTNGSGKLEGDETTAKLGEIFAITSDLNGNLYVTDGGYASGNNIIWKIDTSNPTNFVARIFSGSGTAGAASGTALTAKYSNPCGIVFNPKDGNLYVANYSSTASYFYRVSPATGAAAIIAGNMTANTSNLDGVGTNANFPGNAGYFSLSANGNLIVPVVASSSRIGNMIKVVTLPAAGVTTVAGVPAVAAAGTSMTPGTALPSNNF